MRLFETHKIRKNKSLNGIWDFYSDKTGKIYMPVPACWESNPDMSTYRGRGIYKRNIFLEEEANVRLVFKGVSHTADVYFDEKKLAHHYNAYTPFDVIIKNAGKGGHEIKVEADNSFGEFSALHIPNDYYSYGGITRPAGYEIIPDLYIKNIKFICEFNGMWQGKTVVTLQNLSDKELICDVKLELAGKKTELKNITVGRESVREVEWSETFNEIEPWEPENPKLYCINCTLVAEGKEFDDLIERCGFRTVEIKGKDICLNGKTIFLKGFNRHEDYAGVGCAIPLELMMKDMWLMKDMGANAVRTSHYPNDERFLDICDQEGIMVWEENHARGLKLEDMQNPNFEEQCRVCIDEMLENHYNHPSIIIWGILNECASQTQEGREMYKKQYNQIRSLDSTRPLTSASCKHYTDICLDLPDIVSFNIYSGWYTNDSVDSEFEKELKWIKEAGGKDKPLIISEFGAAALYGFRDKAGRRWSEEGQANLLAESLDIYMNHKDVCGVFIWQFCDCRVTEEGEWYQSRAGMRNNKGIVDRFRRPKIAYETIKTKFKE